MNVVDALCETCGKTIRWLPGAVMLCPDCWVRLLMNSQQEEMQETAVLAEVERILKHDRPQ